jgi:hypothetical protein
VATRELAERIMRAKAIPAPNDHRRELIQKTVLGSLNRAKETIARVETAGVVSWAGGRNSIARSRKLWTALHALDGYLTSQSAWLANYAERHREGLRVGTALTEGTANFLVNRRMNKSADALVATRRRFSASGSLRHLQWHSRLRFWTEVPAC